MLIKCRSCKHIVIFAVLLVFRRRWWLLLHQLLPVHGTRWIQLEPRLYALQIEEMISMAW